MAKKTARSTAPTGSKRKAEKYVLRLFITGNTPQSIRAILNVKHTCENFLKGRYELEIIDIYKNPSLAKAEQIIATPTLIKYFPVPTKRLIGDLSNEKKVLEGLDLRVLAAEAGKRNDDGV